MDGKKIEVNCPMDAIRNGAVIVTDTQMGKAGINKRKLAEYGGEVLCFMSDEDVAETAKKNEKTETREDVKKVEKAETVENQQTAKTTNHLTG